MLIGELAKITGLNTDTLRFYEKMGLIKGKKNGSAYKHYDKLMLERVSLIKQAKVLGFTLQEIRRLILDWESGHMSYDEKVKIFKDKIIVIDQKINDLLQVKNYLKQKLKKLKAAHHG